MKLFNSVVISIALQVANAGLVFLNQVAIIRTYGLADFGVYQHAYVILMAAPAFITLGVYNLASDPKFGRRAIIPSLLLGVVLAPLGLFVLEAKVVAAAFLFTCSYTLGYYALVRGQYIKRSALCSSFLNVCVFLLAIVGVGSRTVDMVLCAALLSTVLAMALSWRQMRRLPGLVREALATFRDLTIIHYGLFAACGILSQLTYVLPLSFAQYAFDPNDFGVAAFGLALARLPFLFTAAVAGVIAKPLAMQDTSEVARLSRLLSTLGMCGTALLALNLPIVLAVAGIQQSADDILLLALYSFLGATLWGAVGEIAWLSNAFRPEFFFKLFNVAVTAAVSLLVFVWGLDIHFYLVALICSTIASYSLRFVYVRRSICKVRIDPVAGVAAAVAPFIAVLHSIPLSLTTSVPIALYVGTQVWSPEARP